MACSVFYKPYQKKLHKALGVDKSKVLKAWQVFFTFNLVSFAWIFFRARNLNDAEYVMSKMLIGIKGVSSGFLFSQGKPQLVILLVALTAYLVIQLFYLSDNKILRYKTSTRWCLYYFLVFFILIYSSSNSTFIYFKF
jgi:hypothetical protein